MLQRLSGSLAQSLRLSSRHFAAYQQHAAFHLSASLDARRQQQDGSGSDSDDSDDEQENPKPQQHVESEGVSDDLLPRFDASYARNPGDCCRCRRHPAASRLPYFYGKISCCLACTRLQGCDKSALRWRSRPSGCACSCRSRLQPSSAPFPAPFCEAEHLQLPRHTGLANMLKQAPTHCMSPLQMAACQQRPSASWCSTPPTPASTCTCPSRPRSRRRSRRRQRGRARWTSAWRSWVQRQTSCSAASVSGRLLLSAAIGSLAVRSPSPRAGQGVQQLVGGLLAGPRLLGIDKGVAWSRMGQLRSLSM